MLADMSLTGEISYIDGYPFTDAQDSAASSVVRATRQSHDTVLVNVKVAFGSATGSGYELPKEGRYGTCYRPDGTGYACDVDGHHRAVSRPL